MPGDLEDQELLTLVVEAVQLEMILLFQQLHQAAEVMVKEEILDQRLVDQVVQEELLDKVLVLVLQVQVMQEDILQ